MLETVAWAVLFMCLGGAVVVIVGVAILVISGDN